MTSPDARDPGSGSDSGWGDDLPLPLTPPKQNAPEGTPKTPPQDEAARADTRSVEVGGPRGPEPTRYKDWEVKGRCSDF